jgi:multiple sugar transport system permease protein
MKPLAQTSQRVGAALPAARMRSDAYPAAWLMPLILVLGAFYLYPVLEVFRFAFSDITLLGRGEDVTIQTLVKTLARPELAEILWVTLVFTGASVLGQQVLGLAVALVVVRGEKRRLLGTNLLRTTALIAWVVPGVAGGIVWKMLMNGAPFGGLNSVLRLFGMAPVQWLSDPDIVMWSVVVANIWRGTAFSMVVMYAALKAIDPVLYEAADVDGANPWQRFVHVTLPQLRAAIMVNLILITIQTLNTFDAVISLTGGGPGRATEVLSLYTFNTVFRNYDLAAGAVLSLLMLVISMSLALFYAKFLPKETGK